MIEAIKFIIIGIIITVIFSWFRKLIVKNAVNVTDEKFQWKKFFSGFVGVFDSVGWAKDIVSLFNLRKLAIYGIIIGIIFAYGYWKGQQGKPVNVNLGYGKEAMIKLDGNYLHITKQGEVFVEDNKGIKIKQISVKDIPALKKKLSPIGLQLKLIGIVGYGVGGENFGGEAGAGVSFFKYWKWRLEAFLTNRGIYLGTSYKITDNSGLGLGAGKGFEGDNRVIFYYKWEF